jgi:transposase-like protein
LRGASWQRCRTHFIRNLLTRVPTHGIVVTYVRTIFAQPDAESVRAQHARTVEHLRSRFPKAADMLDEAAEELLAFTAFPKEHWRQVWSNNPQERLIREIRRRTDVVGIFPNREAIIRPIGAVLCEIHGDWTVVRRYMTINREDEEADQKALKPAPKKRAA